MLFGSFPRPAAKLAILEGTIHPHSVLSARNESDSDSIGIIVLTVGAVWAQGLVGPARVIDGDTLEVVGLRIRIHGIDAPEARQLCSTGTEQTACGQQATQEMRDLIRGEPVRCEPRDIDRYGRIVAVCMNHEGKDVGREMVRSGWALAYRQYGLDYVADEEAASATSEGMWETTFVAPWDWSRGITIPHRPPSADDLQPENDNEAGACLIKGNVSSRGEERIYHVPGGANYEQTIIDPSKGERWFCSEAEAQAAGWRGSLR